MFSGLISKLLSGSEKYRNKLWILGTFVTIYGFERANNFQGRVDGIAPYLYSPGTEIWDCYMSTGRCEASIREYQRNSDSFALQASIYRVVMIIGIAILVYSIWPRVQQRLQRKV